MTALRLKAIRERVLSGRPEPRRGEAGLRHARRLLILDDDDGVRRTVALMATRLGLEVEACSTLAEFEKRLASFVPEILLIDLMMPDVDGIEVISRLGPLCDAAIYVMTGADKRTFEASREVLRMSGVPVVGFLHKPFSAAELREALDHSVPAVPKVPKPAEARGAIELLSPADLEQSARSGAVGPFFQPIFEAGRRRLKGFEALLRVEGQSRAYFAPTYLEYLANDERLSGFITDLVIERSLQFLATLTDRDDLTMSVNIFGVQAVADGFREKLVQTCAEYGVDPRHVILEISEATVCEFSDEDLRKVTQLRLAGFGLSIDDFGTGSSSLGRLASLPFSELKIDKSFCLALPGSESAEAVVEACLGIAHKLDMRVTAEGIETSEVADLLTAMGCDALQGHYFGRALPGDVVAGWIARGCPLPAA